MADVICKCLPYIVAARLNATAPYIIRVAAFYAVFSVIVKSPYEAGASYSAESFSKPSGTVST
jgi:hypothetical protein